MDDIVEWLLPYTAGDCLVATDAPLVVRNTTGRRPCEQLVSRCFGRYEASAHSSNLSLPSLPGGGSAVGRAGGMGWSAPVPDHRHLPEPDRPTPVASPASTSSTKTKTKTRDSVTLVGSASDAHPHLTTMSSSVAAFWP
jgi:hypothetical protein